MSVFFVVYEASVFLILVLKIIDVSDFCEKNALQLIRNDINLNQTLRHSV